MTDKPVVKLIGEDGNAFSIIARCVEAARKAGWSKEKIQEFKDKARGSYDELLCACCEYFEVEDPDDEESEDDDCCDDDWDDEEEA